ncbi:MAG: hypothetical protein J6A55_06090 [Oscillospiraceae bacterium]|nr:hypothetical protein [Oscillospiraceae bacterium]
MSKKIKREKLVKSEKAYRISVIATYIFAAITILSCIFTVPGMDVEKKTEPMLAVYSVAFCVYVLALAACAVMAWVAFKKANKEALAIQSIMLAVSTLFSASNIKMFIVFFLYGIGKDAKVEQLFGNDMASLTEGFTAGWTMLIIAFSVNLLLAILGISKLISKK